MTKTYQATTDGCEQFDKAILQILQLAAKVSEARCQITLAGCSTFDTLKEHAFLMRLEGRLRKMHAKLPRRAPRARLSDCDIASVASKWALRPDERRELVRYFDGKQTCADFDRLTPRMKAAVTDVQRDQDSDLQDAVERAEREAGWDPTP